MLQGLPYFISILFVLVVIGIITWFYYASRSKAFLWIATGWTLLQTIIGLSGVYQDTEAIPPRIMLFGVLPALITILIILVSRRGKMFADRINLKTLTYLHTIRIPVEIVLALLFHYGVMSVYITFEGTNFDIFSGLTAPLVAYLAYKTGTANRKMLVWWNIFCLLLLLNVVVTAVFAIPSPFQKLAFDQPNMAVLYFPFNLLPTVVVPIVLFSHLAAIRQLTKK